MEKFKQEKFLYQLNESSLSRCLVKVKHVSSDEVEHIHYNSKEVSRIAPKTLFRKLTKKELALAIALFDL